MAANNTWIELREQECGDGTSCLAVQGEIDMATAPALKESLRRHDGDLVIDLSGVEFMDSTGVVALMQARQRANANGWRLVVEPAPRSGVRTAFRLLQAEGLLTGAWVC